MSASDHTRLVAIRGATTVEADDALLIEAAVRELLAEIVQANAIAQEDVLSAIFSATPDLHALYPAAAARAWGWEDAPMLCVAEMPVAGAPVRCIRLLLHVALKHGRSVRHVYQRDARSLRPDWSGPT